MKIQSFSDFNIDIKNKISGQHYTTCPQCSHDRKKKNDPCLSVNIDEGLWNCHHCGWKGALKSDPLPKFENRTGLTESHIDFFLSRNISQDTLLKTHVYSCTHFMPQAGKEVSAIAFPYFRNGETVNIKYRDLDKNFSLKKGAELIPYNLDAIKNEKEVFIVEGEIDALSLIQMGFNNTLSVPTGANKGNNNLQYLDNCKEELQHVTRFNILTDFDEPGEKLASDLAKKLMRKGVQCVRLTLPEGFKDVNEMLCKEGKIYFPNSVPYTQEVIANGLPSREQLRMTRKYIPKNSKPALLSRDKTLIHFGEIFAIVGQPGMGKTTIVDGIVCTHLGQESFQFKFNRTPGKKSLLIDTERPPDDVYNSHQNILKRMKNPPIDDQGEIDGLIHLSVSEYGKVDDLKAILERELSTCEFDLAILDGILDFSLSMNDDKDATEVVKWVRALAVKYNCAIVVTIHPNKGSDTIAGHLGSFLYRWCRAILFVRSVIGDKSMRELTGQPDMAKLSHADISGFEPVYFSWDSYYQLMMECDYTPKETRGKEDKMKEAMTSVLDGKRLRYSDLVKALISSGHKEGTAKRWITESTNSQLLTNTSGTYSLNLFNSG